MRAEIEHTQWTPYPLVFSIGFAVIRSRGVIQWLLKEHVTDDTRQELAGC
jgi:hypothetical protein